MPLAARRANPNAMAQRVVPATDPPKAGRGYVNSCLLVLAFAQVACGGRQSWQPQPPHGTTYVYDYQGFLSSDTTVVGGTHGGFPAYGAAFAFRDAKGVHEEEGGKDPFVQSAPIDGLSFNAHLQGQGARLTPGTGAAPAAPTGLTAPPRGVTP